MAGRAADRSRVVSGELARAWAERTDRSDSLATAAERHGDGWAVSEQTPMCDPQTDKPVNFLDVGVISHLAFYRDRRVGEPDPHAGLLVSMHGAEFYRGHYGNQPALKLTFAEEAGAQVEAFVADQEGATTSAAGASASPGSSEDRPRAAAGLRPADTVFLPERHARPPASELSAYQFEPDGPAPCR